MREKTRLGPGTFFVPAEAIVLDGKLSPETL